MAPKRKSPDAFWQEYEEKTGEKVLAHGLGRYVSGWDEFGNMSGSPLWGLIIASSGGFRFHHFPQANWLSVIAQIGSGDNAPKEKTIFIPVDKIISVDFHKETKWYKKIFSSSIPRLLIRYYDEAGAEKELLLFAEYRPEGVVEALRLPSAAPAAMHSPGGAGTNTAGQ
jgi:hypothetical protein